METTGGDIETLIIMALDADKFGELAGYQQVGSRMKGGMIFGQIPVSSLFNFDDLHISSAYTFDALDSSRIFSASPDYLMAHPAEIIGEENEYILMYDNIFKWIGYRRLKTPPKDVSWLGKPCFWYEVHFRCIKADGSCTYEKSLVALDKNGFGIPWKIRGRLMGGRESQESRCFNLAASMIEDSHRAGTMLATVKDATEIKFSVPLGDYRHLFADRTGPLNGSRRKAILHWVAKHLRHSIKGREHDVKRHTRGVQQFSIDGLTIILTPNEWASV